MPTQFNLQITVAKSTVELGDDRQGEASFSVFNASQDAVRARAQLVPDHPVAGPWLSVVGMREREFGRHETERYPVRIDVPLDAPGGSYAFRLDMVGVENPDDDYVQGPTVTFVVPQPEPPEEEEEENPILYWVYFTLAVAAGNLIAFILAIVIVVIISQLS